MTGTFTVRIGRLSRRVHTRALIVAVLLLLAATACVAASLMLGSRSLTLTEVLTALGPDARGPNRLVVVEWRAPRALAAGLFGACLGISGAIFQSLTRNPLGSPDIIGLNTGAYTGVVFVITVGGTGFLAYAAGAMIGGLGAAALVYLLAFRGGVRGFRLIIVGIAVSAMLTSVNTWFSVKADLGEALRAAVWGAGSLNAIQWPPVILASIVAGLLALALPVAGRRMRQLELGDETAVTHGVPVERSKILLSAVGVGFTALVTAAAGPIAFVALAAPQIARRLSGRPGSADLVGSALVGSVLLGGADLIAQHAVPDTPLPVGAVTVLLGGAYLVWLLLHEQRRR
ncbi:iron chelate uptake ABC transporter family permease subunit [Glycomyces sp. NRRL B-16210]|uniref:FecCD family ABC transporter permease n=1 Tax=Glycomyces sp. NRRL B-16210 TaxID=1463821 RepID=UPI0004C23C43|nr:iron chelate uptake ABC transporter family permease subunit [Glycomyces sp. NRRL B-16210]